MTPAILVLVVAGLVFLAVGGFWLTQRRTTNNPPDIAPPGPGRPTGFQALRSVRVLRTPEEITRAAERASLTPSPPQLHRDAGTRFAPPLKETQ